MQYFAFFITFLSITFLSGCYTVPETGRSSLNLMSEGTVSSMAATSFNELKGAKPISTDREKIARVPRVGQRIAAVASQSANLPPVHQWEFVLFEDDEMVNAFAMPGGKVGVYTGLFTVAKTDDQLAAVIGHEVAHVAARHGNERLSQNLVIAGVGVGLAVGTMNTTRTTQAAVLAAYGASATLGAVLPFSRRDEAEADFIGLIYMARAGYDPREAVNFWQNMRSQKGASMPEFLSTHPADDTRIENIKRQLPQVIPLYEAAQ